METEEKLYQCPVCGFHYRDESTANACEAWCREHKSCNIEITAHAVENARSSAQSQNNARKKVIFVYNADSGLLNALRDTVYKIVSPDTYGCNLCRITFGAISMEEQWHSYIESLPHDVEFLHRDDFKKRFPEYAEVKLPALFIVDDGQLRVALEAKEIGAVKDIPGLISLTNDALTK